MNKRDRLLVGGMAESMVSSFTTPGLNLRPTNPYDLAILIRPDTSTREGRRQANRDSLLLTIPAFLIAAKRILFE